MLNLNYKTVRAISEALRRLNNLKRWSYIQDQSKYNELNKQALNCLCTFAVANHAEQEDESINWTRFPKIAIFRAFQKVYVNFDTREKNLEEMREDGGLKKNVFEEITLEVIAEKTSEEFAGFLQECLGTKEYEMYKAASKIATYIELMEHQPVVSMDTYTLKYAEVREELAEYKHVSGVQKMEEEQYWINIIKEISTLRNHARWCELAYIVPCSVLGHLFDTACFAYLMSLEKCQDEKLATKHFFMGLIHDSPETWTGDIPSSIKDRIPGFREVTEKYETKMTAQHFYAKLPQFMEQKVKEVMFEEPENEQHFKLIKGADYLAADLECWKEYVAGSEEPYFLGAIKRRVVAIKARKVEITPILQKLHKWFMEQAEVQMFNPLKHAKLQQLCIEVYNVYAFSGDKNKQKQLQVAIKAELSKLNEDELIDAENIVEMYLGSKKLVKEILEK